MEGAYIASPRGLHAHSTEVHASSPPRSRLSGLARGALAVGKLADWHATWHSSAGKRTVKSGNPMIKTGRSITAAEKRTVGLAVRTVEPASPTAYFPSARDASPLSALLNALISRLLEHLSPTSLSGRDAARPIAGLTRVACDREHHDLVSCQPIDQRERKAPELNAPGSLRTRGAGIGKLSGKPGGLLDSPDEAFRDFWTGFAPVVPCFRPDLGSRLRKEAYARHSASFRALAKTSSAGTSPSSPLS